MYFTTVVFQKNKMSQSTRVNHPQATLFNLMLTAFDVVICHLLMGNTGPTCTKEKEKVRKIKTKLMTCIILFHLLFQELQNPKNTDFSFLLISSSNTAAHISYSELQVTGAQLCLCLVRTSAWLIRLSLFTHSPLLTPNIWLPQGHHSVFLRSFCCHAHIL